ncbi:hypothetical protein EJ04DRAFT_513972 [Polyplosphaeria fusca]|uniref:1-alkyl-2-acetylglycerophosphocholine esterase n=1 Tax=Polyplosphaeria fusca TaxID=682080 RepID=A0A9P4QWP7_9PLEO|nr:hypothetical protein EJ04DRAFT_513972 [Polyplosphaeria fusca]
MLLPFLLLTSTLLARTSQTENGTFALPLGRGPFRTSLQHAELVDNSRLDPWNASHVRRLMISRFDPVPPANCTSIEVPYLTPRVAEEEDEILGGYDYPTGLWEKARLQVCNMTYMECSMAKRDAPIAMFSAGLNTTRLFSQSLVQEIASHGLTVVLVDHPYDTDIVEFPNGDVIFGNHVKKPENGNSSSVEFALEVRAQDISFVMDTLGISSDDKVVMFGHSFGGAATATVMLHDERIRAGVNIDGMMFGPVLNTSLGSQSDPQAFLLWGSQGHNTTEDATWGDFWETLKGSSYVDWAKEFTIVNSTHGSAWDLNMLVDVTGIRGNLSELALSGVGPIPAAPIWNILGRYIPAFFRFALGLEPEDEILQGPSDEFPDVLILRQ